MRKYGNGRMASGTTQSLGMFSLAICKLFAVKIVQGPWLRLFTRERCVYNAMLYALIRR